MKKLMLGLLVVGLLGVCFGERFSDRDWTISQVAVPAAAVRVTNTQSGMLFMEAHGGDVYIAFNATADAQSLLVGDGGFIDMYPASIKYGEYWTAYSTSVLTINYVVLD